MDREGFVLALRDDLKDVVTEPAFCAAYEGYYRLQDNELLQTEV